MLLGAVVGLAACAPQVSGTGYIPPQAAGPVLPPQPAREKVALLLPLSGANASLGQPLLNAAQLALFEQGGPGFEFLPRDTGGTASGAAAAARSAIGEGARILVGPLTAQETAAVASAARGAGVPVLPFTNDANQAAPEVWPLGLTPEQQVRRVVAAAQGQGVQRFGLAAPDGALGRQMAAALRGAARDLGLPAPVVELYPAAAAPSIVARELAARLAPTPDAAPGSGVEMLLLGENGGRARDFVGGLTGAGAAVPPLRLAGLAVWAYDDGLTQQPALAGAWFPGPDPAAHSQFESRYQAAFGERPARVAGVAYDAAALAARAMREAASGGMPRMPVGEVVLGADGALRLNPGGKVQRALAVYALSPGAPAAPVAPAELPGELGY
ncbi:penicillin-binding protein activator [Roseomonas sp. M0104]|uniref:Penicillin-binding protein activator n=1 Tax=Teichococcus coralli TaxID=2545983 RepID=A0A845BK12_9PROT|nr:penicillin-binding protein activator [Pseudoroseomonas coralli]MXP65502.1 penicillin-binding protein activator [Pseudoroseomonas coralli]